VTGDPGEQRRGDGQGRLPGAAETGLGRDPRRRRRAPLPGHRRPGAVRPAGPAVPRPGDRAGPPRGAAGSAWTDRPGLLPAPSPGPDSPCSGYLVEHDGFRLVLDLGAGSLGSSAAARGLLDVDAVYVSHLHADHCIDLVAYSYARRYHPSGVPPQLPVYGPVGTAERICAAFETPPAHGLLDVLRLPRGARGRAARSGRSPSAAPAATTPVECHALRLEAGGRSLTYSGDTGVSDDVVELARDTDLFLCEAVVDRQPRQPAGRAPVRPRGGATRRSRGRPPADAHPPGRGPTPTACSPGRAAPTTARSSWRAAARRTRCRSRSRRVAAVTRHDSPPDTTGGRPTSSAGDAHPRVAGPRRGLLPGGSSGAPACSSRRARSRACRAGGRARAWAG
jgi:hypothetical protein